MARGEQLPRVAPDPEEPVNMFWPLLGAYLLGSVPCGYLLGRLIWKKDIRRSGSGNIGATNLARTVGKPLGGVAFVLTFILDGGKGIAAVGLANVAADGAWLAIAAGALAIAGHNWPVWLGFKGGKGVATSAGVFFMLAPAAMGWALLVFALMLAGFRMVSLASIVAAGVLPLIALWLHATPPVVMFMTVAAAAVIIRHRSNIQRMLRGCEDKLGGRSKE